MSGYSCVLFLIKPIYNFIGLEVAVVTRAEAVVIVAPVVTASLKANPTSD
jgi:hypothetical protein